MAVQRISNVSLFNSTMRNITSTQFSLFTLQEQISSGIKAKDFKGLNGQVEQFVGLEAQTRRLDLYKMNNAVLESRLTTANTSMTTIIEVADQIEDLMVQMRSVVTSEQSNFVLQIQNKMKTIADALNVQAEGRYLFGGTATDKMPVPNSITTNHTPGIPDTGYYAGSAESVMHRIDDNIEMDFPVRADDIAFQRLFAAVDLALKSPDSDDTMRRAIDMIQLAQSDMNTAQARVSSALVNLEQVSARQDTTKQYIRGLTEQVSKTDIVAATTKAANDQAVLQASYQVFARLIQLKLSDYL